MADVVYELRAPITEVEWATYHDIRRTVLFERRGSSSYDPRHPDEMRPGHHPLVLYRDGSSVGVIRVDVEPDRALFRRVAIREELQRQGCGRELLARAEAFARDRGCRRVESFVDAAAVGFYVRCGFRRAGDGLLMVKDLEAAR